jgi:hypothetical protein
LFDAVLGQLRMEALLRMGLPLKMQLLKEIEDNFCKLKS